MCSSPGRAARLVPAPCTARTRSASPGRRGRSPPRAGRALPPHAAEPGPDRSRNQISLPWVLSSVKTGRPGDRAGDYRVRVRLPARKARRDLLDQPAVAVRVAERDERAVALVIRSRAGYPPPGPGVVEYPAGVVEYLAHLGAAAGELGPGRLDVGDGQLQAVSRTRRGRRDPGAEDDRALGGGRGQLHHPEVLTGGAVGIQPPAQRLVEVLGLVHVGHGHHHDLEFHVHDCDSFPVDAGGLCRCHLVAPGLTIALTGVRSPPGNTLAVTLVPAA